MTLFGVAALMAPVVGPTLGGWITDNFAWRWVFFINIPVGLLALGAVLSHSGDPEYLTAQRTELRRQPISFDDVGLALLAIVMACWEIVLSKGQEWDWLGDPFWRVQTLAMLFVFGLAWLIVWELRHPNPVINFRPLPTGTSPPAALSSSAPSACCMRTAPRCLGCCSRCSGTMR